MTHYLVIQGVQLDGFPPHKSGDLSYLEEFSDIQREGFVAGGVVEVRQGDIPNVPPPPPPPPPPPEPDPEPEPLYLGTWTGEGDPPPATWAYYHKTGLTGLDPEPLYYLVGDTVVDKRPKDEPVVDEEPKEKPRRKKPADKDGE